MKIVDAALTAILAKDLGRSRVDVWKDILADTPPRLEVDFASAHGNKESDVDMDTSNVVVDCAVKSRIKKFCIQNNISPEAFTLWVLQRTLRAYSHQAFAIGVYHDNEEGGNILLVPFEEYRHGGSESVQALHERWTNNILPHSHIPFDKVKELGYGCNVILSCQRSLTSSNKNVFGHVGEEIDLHVSWEESDGDDGEDDTMKINFYSGIGRWPGLEERFQYIIHQILAMEMASDMNIVAGGTTLTSSSPSNLNSSFTLTSVDNLLPEERNQVLALAAGPKDPIIDSCLHEQVEKQAQLRPNAVALMNKCGTETMTYGELDTRAHRLAVELQRRGARPNTYVGILMGEKTFEMYVAVLGVLKAGAAYVPMDAVLFPSERIRFIVDDTDMKLLVTVGEHAGLCVGDIDVDEVLVEEAVMSVSYDEVHLDRIVEPSDCAYMIYTSGTTGVPKGVACHHIGPVNMIFYESGVEFFSKGVAGEDVVGCAAPIIFDVFVWGYFGALGSGLTLSLDMKCCTMLVCTPSVADIYLQDKMNINIKMMCVGGEACIQGLESKVPYFVNIYGPTEASIWCVTGMRSETIGRPLPNTLCYVVHPDDGTLCPPGVSGELWVGGIGVSIGYHNRPELTAKKFITNPFGDGRVYRTGDRVKWDANGELVFMGRFDHQVKLRGYRIELGEIQAELEKQAGVNGALVVVHEEKLIAFVASSYSFEDDKSEYYGDGTLMTSDEALAFAGELMGALKSNDCSLASYMIPSHILVMDEFPLTMNGKIDRKSLMSRLDDDGDLGLQLQIGKEGGVATEYVPPVTAEEEEMVAHWQAILGRNHNSNIKTISDSETDRDCNHYHEKKIGMNDNFYDLGGHSIVAMALAAVLECDARSIAAHPTPASLLAHLQLQASEAEAEGADAGYLNLLSSLALEEVSDLTRTEKRMVFMQLQNPDHTTYNMPFCVRFNKDVDLLRNAQAVVDMLPILHTRFVNGKAVEDVNVIVEDLTVKRARARSRAAAIVSGSNDYDDEEEVNGDEYDATIRRIVDCAFDVSDGPLCRFGVDVDTNTLYGNIHHSIGDGRSIQILLDAINVGRVKASTSEWSIRKYAAFEALPEVVDDQRALVEKYVEMLGDTPSRLEVDFASASSLPPTPSYPTPSYPTPSSTSTITRDTASSSHSVQSSTSISSSSIILDCATRMSLEKYCRREKISLFSLALGVMHKAIRAYSHEAFAIGTAYDARPSCFRDSVGMFVNTVLVPFGNPTSGYGEENSSNNGKGKDKVLKEETLKELHDRWTNSILPLATAPFDMISAAGYGCNVFLAFNVGIFDTNGDGDNDTPRMQSVNDEGIDYDNESSLHAEAKFDLTISWEESDIGDGSLTIGFESGIGRWPCLEERFQYIIQQILAMEMAMNISSNGNAGEGDFMPSSSLTTSTPPTSWISIDNLLPEERNQVLALAAGPKDPIIDSCLHELVEKQARLRPNAVALMNKCGTETMTYGELDTRAHRLAVELQRRGARPNTYVGILMGEKTFEMYVAVLGVLKAGAAYVPMDAVLFPSERIRFIVEDTDMKLLVTVGEHAGLCVGDVDVDEVLVEEAVMNVSYDEVHLDRIVESCDCAYMIYTSGTTGVPKGVACHHIGPVNMIFYESGVEFFSKGVAGEDVVGCSAPLIFDFFTWGYFGALGSGLTLSLDMKCCSFLHCTTALADIFLKDKTNKIKLLSVGGEACIQGLEFRASIFLNFYGPTEASMICTSGSKSDTIGKPLPNTLCYVVHPDDGTLCPPGVSGELWVGGIGVSIGYHNRPELTAKKFITNPFGDGRVYRTGDRVKWDANGELVFMGRFDHQVKLRGYRIELGEIQAELEKQDGVNGALVVVHEEKLIAFVASSYSFEDDTSDFDGTLLRSDEALAFAGQLMGALKSNDCSLASYMIPSHILVMDEFPLTMNGKIDRKSLMSRLDDDGDLGLQLQIGKEGGVATEYVPPVTAEEEEMVAHWQAILGRNQNSNSNIKTITSGSERERDCEHENEMKIGMNDNFYDLGGHSIVAMALAAVLECDVRSIAAHPTPASLLAHLQLQASEAEAEGADAGYLNLLSSLSLEEVSDLTRTEKRMVFMQLQNPDHTTYNMPFCVKFNKDVDLLRNAQAVVDMLPILHTRFVNGKAVEDVNVIVEDLSRGRVTSTAFVSGGNGDEEVNRDGDDVYIRHIVDCAFDVSDGPLCRFGVDVDTNTLYGNIHHSIGDGRSIQILLDAINVGRVKASTSEWSIRKYAAFEALPEVVDDQRALVEKYVEMLGDTPSRLEVDFASASSLPPTPSYPTPSSTSTITRDTASSSHSVQSSTSISSSSIILDCATRMSLEKYCRREKISLFSLALGVMHKAIRAYSHEAFAIGTAYDARPSCFRDSVGMFVNTVLVPFGNPTSGYGEENSSNNGKGKDKVLKEETLKELHDRWTNSILPLATAPFDMISAAGYGCNVFLAFNVGIFDTNGDGDNDTPRMQSVNDEGIDYDNESSLHAEAKFDLTISWEESDIGDGSLTIGFESGIGRWPCLEERFQYIIQQILAMEMAMNISSNGNAGEGDFMPSSSLTTSTPPTSWISIDNLLPEERNQVLALAAGPKDPIIDSCLHELVEKQARLRPNAVALMNKCGTETMTYGELDTRAHRLAVELQRRGARPNTYVGILMGEKTFEMYVAVLGVLKAGAAYVPMDAVLFPHERIRFIMEDTDMKLLVTVGEHAGLCVGDVDVDEVLVEEAVMSVSYDEVHLDRIVESCDCAYMIYTSGTTGVPKGVACHHIGPVNMIFNEPGVEFFGIGVAGEDVLGCSASHTFDPFVFGFFGALGSGLTLSLDMKCCTMIDCTPSVADIFLCNEKNNIIALSVGGEACIQGLEHKVDTFKNMYGPTETSIQCTSSIKSNTIGKPLPNTLCYVVHPDDGALCPPGVSGELWVGGIGVSIGYHNRPELTAKKFITNPFGDGRVYRTGDRVKWDANGELVFMGRFDHQVKLRGYRIELGEIQAELEKQDGVNGALVVVHEETLIAFVASSGAVVSKTSSESNPTAATADCVSTSTKNKNEAFAGQLMEALKSNDCSLASYMIPSHILVMDEFPLTMNGKIDRKSLMSGLDDELGLSKEGVAIEYVPPVTAEEEAMVTQWQDIFSSMSKSKSNSKGEHKIGMNTNFYDLGGHSILAMALAAVLECDVRFIAAHPTPASLLAHLRLQASEAESEGAATMSSKYMYLLSSLSLEEVSDLTRTEKRMVFMQLQNPDHTTYNMPFCVKFNEDVDLLRNAQAVVDMLPILHTRFVNGKAVEDVDVIVEDLSRGRVTSTAFVSGGNGDEEVNRDGDDVYIRHIVDCAFDVSDGPLCRFGVDVDTNTLYGNIHHSIGDGRSIQILLDAINVGRVKASTSEWSIRKYAAFEALPEVVNDQRALVEKYVEMLGDTPAKLEVDFARPMTFHNSNIVLDSTTRMSLERYCRREKISLFSLALGVMHKAIRAYSHEAFAIGTAYDARPSRFRDSVGMFVNTVLVPFGIDNGEENISSNGKEETLKELHDRWTNSILPLATAPFDMVSAAGYGCNVFLAFNVGIFDTDGGNDTCRMQSFDDEGISFHDDDDDESSTFAKAKFDLTISWEEGDMRDGSIMISFESGIGRWPSLDDRFQYIIHQILAMAMNATNAACGATLISSASLPTLTPTSCSWISVDNLLPEERNQVLALAAGPKDPIIDSCLHELVEKQAQLRPNAVALMNKCGTETMTYGELDTRAHRLAVELQRRGARPNTYVGILMGEKTFEMYVAVLGVLKAGAAYVPMDAVLFPSERIRFIMEDTDMKLLVTVGEHAGLCVEDVDVDEVLVEEAVMNVSYDEVHLDRIVESCDCAYMIYTSGTTGVPKGVACHHIGPVNMIFYESGVEFFSKGVAGEDVIGCPAPLIFDFFTLSYFGALGSGLTLSLDMKCCTILMCTPSVANIFLKDKTNNIHSIFNGGEACIQGLEANISNFVNGYGPTEASIMFTAGKRSDTIGRPLPNTLCYVVHPDDGTLCPPGVSGELWVGGIGVSIGYHNRPELTAKKFITNPFGDGRVYRTGDRVKWDANGELVFMGRFDHQVKLRGYRIELGEIQAELEKQAGVNGALVVVHEEKLIAFVASSSSFRIDSSAFESDGNGTLSTSNEALTFAGELMGALKSNDCSLASYMIPSHILVMDEFPLTLNGKIDRKSLISRLDDDDLGLGLHIGREGGVATEYVPPVTAEEEEMVAHWQAVLGRNQNSNSNINPMSDSETDRDRELEHEIKIGMNDNFYDLGGHSIVAMALAAVLECDVRSIAAHPTPASLLAHLQLQASEAEAEGADAGYMNLLSSLSLEELSNVATTEKMMLQPKFASKNMPVHFQFNEDVDLLRNAQAVVDMLPILHTRFVNGKAVEDVDVIVEDLSRGRVTSTAFVSGGNGDEEVNRDGDEDDTYIIQRIVDCPFDVSVGPLCRFGVDVETNTLYGSIHHSIGDGRSIQILLDAINVGRVKASTSEWSIRKYAAFEALPEVVNNQRALVEKYVEMLGDTPAKLEVNFTSTSASRSTNSCLTASSSLQSATNSSSIILDCATRVSLEKYCRKEKISLFSLALGVMHKVIRAYSHEAYAIGTAYDARPSCFRDSVGMFVNTVLVPFGIDNGEENSSKEETLKELHDRWSNSILPLATAPFDMVSAAGYGCNVFLGFNVGIFSGSQDDSFHKMKSLPKSVLERDLRVESVSQCALMMEWGDYCSSDGSINVAICRSMGCWPGIDERFQFVISQILGTLP